MPQKRDLNINNEYGVLSVHDCELMDFRMEERLCDGLQIHSSRFDSVSWPGGFLWIQRQKYIEFFVPASRNPLKTGKNWREIGQMKRTDKNGSLKKVET